MTDPHTAPMTASELAQAAAELLEWSDTGRLCDGIVRRHAASLKHVPDHLRLRVAEDDIEKMALRAAASPRLAGSREETKSAILREMAGRRLLNDVDDDLHDEIAEAIIAVVTPSWQDIESAKKDVGKEILAAVFVEGKMKREPFLSFWSPTLGKFFASPTHWMPLPAPPTSHASQHSGGDDNA